MEKSLKESGTSNFLEYIIYFAFVHLFSTDLVLFAPSPLRLNHTERFSTIRKAKKFFFAQREDRVM